MCTPTPHRCSITDCERPYYAKGFCNLHWRRNHKHGDPLFLIGRMGPLPTPPETRFWAKVDKNGPVPDFAPHLGPCWVWVGGKSSAGYGAFYPAPQHGPQMGAHCFAYQLLVAPLRKGMHIDHLCRVRACVNPGHLEQVPPRENTRRGLTGKVAFARHAARTQCKNGHAFTEANTKDDGRQRVCIACARVRSRESQRRRRAALKAS